MSRIGQAGGKCPKCKGPTTLVDFNSVDIGVGTQEFEHSYGCSTCGVFGYVDESDDGFTSVSTVAVFDDGSRVAT